MPRTSYNANIRHISNLAEILKFMKIIIEISSKIQLDEYFLISDKGFHMHYKNIIIKISVHKLIKVHTRYVIFIQLFSQSLDNNNNTS